MSLRKNTDPIREVPAAQRDVWTKRPGWRCDHEDGRGRCTSRDTKGTWTAGRVEHYCERHRGRTT